MMNGFFRARFGGEYTCSSSGVSYDRKPGSGIYSLCAFFYMTKQSASRPLISLDQLKSLAMNFLAMSGVFHNDQTLGFHSHLLQCIAYYQHCSKQFCCIPQREAPSCET